MSLKSTDVEKTYLKALGYQTTNSIGKKNRKWIEQLRKSQIPIEYVAKLASSNKYTLMNDKNKENFIKQLINHYNDEIQDAEIIKDYEDEFLDAQERIPKPKHKELSNINNNLSKMSKRVPITFNQRRGEPLGSLTDFLKAETKNSGIRNRNAAFLKKTEPIMNTTYDYSAKYEHPDYAAAYAKKIGGKAYRADINADNIDDIIITNKNGLIKYVNGHTIKPSSRGKDLKYYDSDAYKNAPFEYTNKNGKTVKDLYGQHPRAEYNKAMTPQAKKAANETLRKAGFATYQVKEKTLNKILKESAATLYKNVIDTIVDDHKEVNKTKLKRQLPMSRFETLIVNAILLKMYNADFSKSKSYLDQLVANLKKTWDHDKKYKQTVVKHANSAIDVLSKPLVLDKLAEPLYKITLKDSKHGEIYKSIIELIGNGINFSKELEDYYRKEVNTIERKRLDDVNAYRKQYYAEKKATKGSKKTTEEPVKLLPLDSELMPPVRKPKKQQVFSDDSTEDYVFDE